MVASLISVNGHIETSDAHLLSVDRGLHYGDGLFETIAMVNPNHFFTHPLFSYHTQRLCSGLERLQFPCLDIEQLFKDIEKFVCYAQKSSLDPWILKLIITRGTNKRSYLPEKNAQPNILMFKNDFVTYPSSFYTEGINLAWGDVILPVDPQLAGIKHLNRLPQVLASAQLNMLTDCQEILLCNAKGYVIEGTKSNVFWVGADNQIRTPCLKESGVAGVMRAWIIEKLRAQQLSVIEVKSTPDEVQEAKEIFLCNSIFGIWPVKKLAHRHYSVGAISKWLYKTYQKEFYLV